MKRVLFVTYYFPPLGGIGSLRLNSFASHLVDYGWNVTVLAPRDGAYFRDSSLEFPEDQIIRTGSIELSRTGKQLLRAGGDDVHEANVEGILAFAKAFVRRYVYFPDAQIGWYPPAVWAALRHAPRQDYDAIFSSSFPITAHLIARTLHRRLGVPWVAEFRDPWSMGLPEASRARTRAARLERTIGREASAVVTVSPSWAEMFATEWNRDVNVIRNGHDDIPPIPAPAEPRFTLAYLGTYYPQTQDLGALWPAVHAINVAGDARVEQIRFIGELSPALAHELHRAGLDEIVSSTGFLPHDKALEELAQATALIVAGPRDISGMLRGQVAAKLSEYLATGLPIIYVGHPGGDAAGLLTAHPGTHIVPTGDVDAAIRALRAVQGEKVQRDVTDLSRHALAGQLAAVLDQVITA